MSSNAESTSILSADAILIRLQIAGVDVADISIVICNGTVSIHGTAPTVRQLNLIEGTIASMPGENTVLSWIHLPTEAAPTRPTVLRIGVR